MSCRQPDRFPKVGIRPAQFCEVFHRIGDRVTMFAQALGLDPLVQNGESAPGRRSRMGFKEGREFSVITGAAEFRLRDA